MLPNKALQPTVLPSLRYGKTAAELRRWMGLDDANSKCAFIVSLHDRS
jgi:hypothetical protein